MRIYHHATSPFGRNMVGTCSNRSLAKLSRSTSSAYGSEFTRRFEWNETKACHTHVSECLAQVKSGVHHEMGSPGPGSLNTDSPGGVAAEVRA